MLALGLNRGARREENERATWGDNPFRRMTSYPRLPSKYSLSRRHGYNAARGPSNSMDRRVAHASYSQCKGMKGAIGVGRMYEKKGETHALRL